MLYGNKADVFVVSVRLAIGCKTHYSRSFTDEDTVYLNSEFRKKA